MTKKRVVLVLCIAVLFGACGIPEKGVQKIESEKAYNVSFDFEGFMKYSDCEITSWNDSVIEVAKLLDFYTDNGVFETWFDFENFKDEVMKKSNDLVGKYCKAIELFNNEDGQTVLSVTCLDDTRQDFKLSASFVTEVKPTDCIFAGKVLRNPSTCTVPKAVDWSAVCRTNLSQKVLSDEINNYLNRLVYIYEKHIRGKGADIKHFIQSFELWSKETNSFADYGVKRVITRDSSLYNTWKCTIAFPDKTVKINIRDDKINVTVKDEV